MNAYLPDLDRGGERKEGACKVKAALFIGNFGIDLQICLSLLLALYERYIPLALMTDIQGV